MTNTEIARRDHGRLVLRTEPMRLRWSLQDLVSADGHAVRATVSCSVRALSEPAEQKLFAEVFLADRPVASQDHIAQHFTGAFRTAAAALIAEKPAVEWVSPQGPNVLIEAIRNAGKRIAFSCGLELLAPFHAEIDSPSLEQQRQEELQRSLAEQRAAGRIEHFNRASELLKQFQSISRQTPGLSPGDVLKQLNPADQGMVLQTLLMASAKEKTTTAAFAVAGPSLLTFDPAKSPVASAVAPLPTTLGPLRSVQRAAGSNDLLVGARSGVYRVDQAAPSAAVAYADPAIASQLGFSRALLWNNQIWATHSEAGLVGWNLDYPSQPNAVFRPADLAGAQPRNLQALDESRLVFSGGNRILTLTRAQDNTFAIADAPAASAEVVAILLDRNRVLVVCKNGTVEQRDPRTLAVMTKSHPAGDACTAALLPWLGATRLLLATDDGPVLCIGLDDELVTQYQSPYRGMRAICAAADVVIALAGDRQRIVCWNAWNPRTPAAELFVPSLAKHRAADVDL